MYTVQGVLNWQPFEVAKSKTCHPQKMVKSRALQYLGVANIGLNRFWGGVTRSGQSFQRAASS